MRHEVFGDIHYDADGPHWVGKCVLPAFAEYGREPHDITLEAPDDDFRRGVFPLTIQD